MQKLGLEILANSNFSLDGIDKSFFIFEAIRKDKMA
ncbi:hypothetical protein ABIB40_000193 [Pedobacter sp. UYP30]